MTDISSRFHFASAPDSWGVLDYPGPSWTQSYEKMLDEMVAAGYTGSELGRYVFFPTDPAILKPQLDKRKLKLLGSFVQVVLSDPASGGIAVEHIRKVGNLLAALKAPFWSSRTHSRLRGAGSPGACPRTEVQRSRPPNGRMSLRLWR